ncbi:helix-turn-helix transcriptional regulator [Siccationidurans soli]|uniref:Helix-turn-helix transcriptional regulator n=1 Tax=Hymenobacter negativus TaxID=2795026 RepID=A0ABS3QM06_9BACT|nr:helix-turn-helix transcriptional regulator [Hymenobacter negativus]
MLQLKQLVAHELLRKQPFPESQLKAVYHLTTLGESLLPLLTALGHWSNEHHSPIYWQGGLLGCTIRLLAGRCYSFSQCHRQKSPASYWRGLLLPKFGHLRQGGSIAFGATPTEGDEPSVALEAQPHLVFGGRVLVGLELRAHLLDEVGVAAQQGDEGFALGAALHLGEAVAGLFLLEAGQQTGGLSQVRGRELALGQRRGQGLGLLQQGAHHGGQVGIAGF